MFRIDRSFVNLSAACSVHVGDNGREAGAEGRYPDAAALVADMDQVYEQAQEILDEAEQKAREEAETIINDAREKSAMLLVNAREEAEEIRRSAWGEGYAEGAEEGKHSFDEQLSAKMHEDDEILKSVTQKLYDELKSAYDGLEDEVVGLSIEIVRKLITPDEEGMDAFEALIKNALKQINPSGKIIIRVSPAEYERFFSTGGVVYELGGGITVNASVLRDVSLQTGDCIIDTEESTTNAGVGSQMKYIELAFEKSKIDNGN